MGQTEQRPQLTIRKLTPEQRQQALEKVKQAHQVGERLLGTTVRGDIPQAWELLNEARDQRGSDLA